MAADVQDTKTTTKYETFSYLPLMTAEQVRKQVAYMLKNGWNPAIEHVETNRSVNYFWYMWKLPLFGETDINKVLAEIDACKREFPKHLIRLIAYDNYSQSQGLSFVVHRG